MATSRFSIKVTNSRGSPVSGATVAVSGSTDGLLMSPYFKKRNTGSDGWAHFEYEYTMDYNIDMTVEINNRYAGRLSFADGGTASFTID